METTHPPPRSDPYLQALINDLRELEQPMAVIRDQAVDALTTKAHVQGRGLETRELTRGVLQEAMSAAGTVQGQYISIMRERALGFLRKDPHYQELATIPVAMLPTGLLNGQACFNPSGDPFILIDSGMMRRLTDIMHAFRSFLTWGFGENAHCRDHSQLDFAQTFIGLTVIVLSHDSSLKRLCPALIENCPSMQKRPEPLEAITRYASVARDFVLLHEYGHVALGHLRANRPSAMAFGSTTISTATATHADEYEADSFAVVSLRDMSQKLSSKHSRDHAVWVLGEPMGVLLRFWDLLEALLRIQGHQLPDTHPPAISRWRKIHADLIYPGVEKDFLSDVDDAFETILQWYRLPPANSRAA